MSKQEDETLELPKMFDRAKIGTTYLTDRGMHVVVYSAEKVVKILVKDNDMTEEEAWEHFDYNISGAWLGDGTPIFVYGRS